MSGPLQQQMHAVLPQLHRRVLLLLSPWLPPGRGQPHLHRYKQSCYCRQETEQTWKVMWKRGEIEEAKAGERVGGKKGRYEGLEMRWLCNIWLRWLMMMMMEWTSCCQHSELYWGPVRDDQRCRIQSFLACFVCRECQLPVHPVSGGSPAAGATLLWWFWRGTKFWWSMHWCPDGMCRIRVYIWIRVFILQ